MEAPVAGRDEVVTDSSVSRAGAAHSCNTLDKIKKEKINDNRDGP